MATSLTNPKGFQLHSQDSSSIRTTVSFPAESPGTNHEALSENLRKTPFFSLVFSRRFSYDLMVFMANVGVQRIIFRATSEAHSKFISLGVCCQGLKLLGRTEVELVTPTLRGLPHQDMANTKWLRIIVIQPFFLGKCSISR